ncbi:hypothetical protein ACA910_010449 [Epithemia clementina (nom. ined.)]
MKLTSIQLALLILLASATITYAGKVNNTKKVFLRARHQEQSDSLRTLAADCGNPDGACCSSTDTSFGAGYCYDNGLKICSADNICVDCGGFNQKCCDTIYGLTCDDERHHCASKTNTCQNCGYDGEPCCNHDPATPSCRDPFKSFCDLSGSTPTCKSCGATGGTCCEGPRPCESGFAVCDGTSNKCVSCGGPGQKCCPDSGNNGICNDDAMLRCVADGATSLGICENCGEEGTKCCTGANARQCKSSQLFCNANDECKSCGDSGKQCCPGKDSSTAPGSGTCHDVNLNTCVSDGNGGGVCATCGGIGERCCSGDKCDSIYSACNNKGFCEECGRKGGPCCDGFTCNNAGLYVCNMNHISGTETCEDCGGLGQLACSGFAKSHCDSEFLAVKDGICQTCGGDGEQCCTGPIACTGSASSCAPDSNMCVPTASIGSMNCPAAGSPWREIPASTVTINKSIRGVLCRILLVKGEDKIPVARSYDAGEWHQYAGDFSGMVVSCGETACMFDLTAPAEGSKYMLGATNGYVLSNEENAARFFESTTFGMPLSDITSLAGKLAFSGESALATWINTQMDESKTPVSSLRQFYRKHVNGKLQLRSITYSALSHVLIKLCHPTIIPGIFEGTSNLGEVTKPCEKLTTYRRYAFSIKDYDKYVNISSLNGGKKIEIDGRLVTVVNGTVTAADGTTLDGSYRVCDRPEHFVGGAVKLAVNGKCLDTSFGGINGNPPVNAAGIAGINLISLDSTKAGPIDQDLYQGQTQMLTIKKALTDSVCGNINYNEPGQVPAVYATYNGLWFVHTPRFKILNNTLTETLNDGGGSIIVRTSGGAAEYKAECANVARTFLNEDRCFLSTDPSTCAVNSEIKSLLVCGSPNEVSNDLALGGTQFNGAFDLKTSWGITSGSRDLWSAKRKIWTGVVLSAPDQLRQRMAWALSQIFIINSATIGVDWTEQHANYYDIFVKHAFGNYRDVLKEVSYSPMMASFLSYHESKSTAYHMSENDVYRHPDENYAREIMQLFSIGLVMLNEDGTPADGGANTYSNEDIMEYARVWTGFQRQHRRGNIENGSWDNKIDPMQIRVGWRDLSPKMGLQGKYIGEGLPLCSDLPEKHFLKAGAKYRLLGKRAFPELQKQQDWESWEGNPAVKRFKADPNGDLYLKLCNSDGAKCNYAATVTLSENLKCTNNECNVDTLRTVEVESGIFYEYIRPACANLAFYENPTKIRMRDGSSSTYMCADPRVDEAAALCCNINDQRGYRRFEYLAERVRYSTAQARCAVDVTKEMCVGTNVRECTIYSCSADPYYWTKDICQLKIKIDSDRKVAIVHNVSSEALNVTTHVNENTKTFFRVHWNEVSGVDSLIAQCGATNSPCKKTADGSCVCGVSASEYQAFYNTAPPTKEDVLTLPFGAFKPSGQKVAVAGTNDVWVYGSGTYSKDTVFEVIDHAGQTQLRKNMRSTVSVAGTSPTLKFPTPMHIISLAEENDRDAIYETEAALDHYFYHPNTAPFLAYRFAQRFGISNPTPLYVKTIARAFKNGQYTSGGITFGSGRYGDLAATIAAVLLHSEARNVLLEADSVHGAFREPLLKIIQLMRTMEFSKAKGAPMTLLQDIEDTVHQMVFESPDVFSFFPPDYEPNGIIGASSMVSPEASVINSPEIFSTVNGFESLVKYGLMDCFGGFGRSKLFMDGSSVPSCSDLVSGGYHGSTGHLTVQPHASMSASAIIDQLSLLLTSGRLSSSSRGIVTAAYQDELASTDHERAIIRAQQLILTTPEFHTTGRVKPTGASRAEPSIPNPTGKPYKAVVFLMMGGGCDSFNMIVPHTCSGSTLVDQYKRERGELALTDSERNSRVIDITGQPCQKFGLHPKLQTVQTLYNDGDLAFYFNTGVLNAPSSKTNYSYVTESTLFAHNSMQQEVKRVDPFDAQPGTGVLGRLSDVLSGRGYQPNSFSIDVASVAVTGYVGVSISPTVVNRNGVISFHPRPSGEADIKVEAQLLNGGHDLWSSNIFGEAWSNRFARALWETDVLESFVGSITLPTPPDYKLADSFETITKLMMTNSDRGSDRDVYYVGLNGFDHHDNMKENLAGRFEELDRSLDYFQATLKAQGLWDDVTIVALSDFGRTMTPNSGQGSDHGWGGNYFVAGGGIKGKRGLCQYPSDITSTSPLNVGRGRMLPTCAWESVWNPVVEWMLDGQVSNAERNAILVNAAKSGTTMYKMADLFQ